MCWSVATNHTKSTLTLPQTRFQPLFSIIIQFIVCIHQSSRQQLHTRVSWMIVAQVELTQMGGVAAQRFANAALVPWLSGCFPISCLIFSTHYIVGVLPAC